MPVIRLPDLLKDWPMKRAINPHYESTAIESAQWLESFNILTPRTRAAFKLCNPSLLSALAYPHSSAEQFRLSCDMMSFFLLFDEFSDSASAGEVEEVVRVLLDVFAYVSYSLSSRLYGLIDDASSNPDKPRAEGETVFGIMFQRSVLILLRSQSNFSMNVTKQLLVPNPPYLLPLRMYILHRLILILPLRRHSPSNRPRIKYHT